MHLWFHETFYKTFIFKQVRFDRSKSFEKCNFVHGRERQKVHEALYFVCNFAMFVTFESFDGLIVLQ